MGEPERFFFVHLQKTGGTALYQRLRDSFGPVAVYPTQADQGNVVAVVDVDHLVEQFRAHRNELRVITGHFPLCAIERLEVPFTTFTILRDPIERTLSLLRRRQVADERFQGRDLADIYDDSSLQNIIRNHMVKMLSLTADEMGSTPLTLPGQLDHVHLERAKRNLDRIDVVGLQDRFDDFCAELEVRFGWDLGPPRFANRTPHGPVPADLRNRIAADNDLDVDLYDYAKLLVEERLVG